MVDPLPDPNIPLSDRERARLRPEINQTLLQGFLALYPPGIRAATYEIACTEPDFDAIHATVARFFDVPKDEGSPPMAAPAFVLRPELQAIFDDPIWETAFEKTAASSPGFIRIAWEQHRETGLPPAAQGIVVDGIDLAGLNAEIARCLDAFVETETLDSSQREILQASVAEANRILPQLSADAKAYFHHLELIARGVARYVSDAPAE